MINRMELELILHLSPKHHEEPELSQETADAPGMPKLMQGELLTVSSTGETDAQGKEVYTLTIAVPQGKKETDAGNPLKSLLQGFGNPPAAHCEYMEQGRRPRKYRSAGSTIIKPDEIMPYPRVCAHRGFNTVAPENSLPAYGAAIALGAEEIEFDLWPTTDGEIVSIHDDRLERVSDGTGLVYEHSYAELLQYDFGINFGEAFRGLRILKFEEILKQFACHVIMNIHIKELEPYDEEILKKIIALIREYGCEKYVYFMTSDSIHRKLAQLAPDICRCCSSGESAEDAAHIVDRAIALGCKKLQFVSWKPFTQEMVDKAHANGIICNICQADTAEDADKYLAMGIDTIMTNDYQRISQAVRSYPAAK